MLQAGVSRDVDTGLRNRTIGFLDHEFVSLLGVRKRSLTSRIKIPDARIKTEIPGLIRR